MRRRDLLHVDDVIPIVATGALDFPFHGHRTITEEDHYLDYFGVRPCFLNGAEILKATPKHTGVVGQLELYVEDSAVRQQCHYVGNHFGAGWEFHGEDLGDGSTGNGAE